MSTKTQEGVSPKAKASHRNLLKRGALIVLGASMLIQPAGAVFGEAMQEKKEDTKTQTSAAKNFDKKKKGTTKKRAPKKEETPKKEGAK
jgi:hypothetical protein